MSEPSTLSADMLSYLKARNTPPDEHLQSLIDIAGDMPRGAMRTSTEAGTFLTVLSTGLQPKFAIEVGTFIGYSSLCIARGLAVGGRLLCLDVNEEWTAIARDHWERAGVADKIELVIAPASQTLAGLSTETSVDLAYIDADKAGYIDYYEQLVPRLSPRGVIGVDNTMWSGRVLDESDSSEGTVALRAFNDHVAADERTINVTLPIGDGITLICLSG